MVFWPSAEEKGEEEDSSGAMALKNSGDELADVGSNERGDVGNKENEDVSENWPANLAGINGATLAASAASRLANALNVDFSLVVSQMNWLCCVIISTCSPC